MISDVVADFLQGGLSMFVATRDAELEPHGARGWAVVVDDDRQHLTVYVHRAAARWLLSDLAENGQIAVAFTRPTDHRAFQVKGVTVATRPARAEEKPVVMRQVDGFLGELVAVGIPPAMVRNWKTWPCVAVQMRVTDVFEQTPGPRAGERVP